MARYIDPFPQYILISGAPNSGGYLNFFETGTNTSKIVYSDSDFSTSIGSEVQLDGSGRIPDIYLNGAYSVTLTDANGNELDSADPIGVDSDITPFDVWSSSNTYASADIVQGSNGLYYQSLAGSNLNNDPTSTPALWEQFYFFPTWNTVQTYAAGQLAIGSDGSTYQSQLGSNQGNNPTLDDGTNWQKLLQEGEDITVSGLSLEKIEAGTVNLDFLNADVLRWRWLFDTDESLDLERYNSSGVLQDKVLSFDNTTGALSIIGATTITGATAITGDTAIAGDLILTQTAAAVILEMNSNALQTSSIQFQDVNVKRWEMGQDSTNSFSLTSFDASGLNPQTVITFPNGTVNVGIALGNLLFPLTNQGIAVTSTSNSSFDINFTGVTLNTATVELFDNTITTGNRLFNIWKGNTTNAITCQVNAEDGSIHTALDRAGETDAGVKLGKITLSTNAASGGEDGDLWLQY